MSADERTSAKHPIPIEWRFPSDVTTRYATNIVVQHSEHEFTISFFEIKNPIVTGSPEQREVQLSNIESVPADCVARIVVSSGRMTDFVNALQQNLEKAKKDYDI